MPTRPRHQLPVILVNEEICGVHEYIKDVCRRFAKPGYMAVAPEIYARIADLSKMTDTQQIVREVIPKKPDAELYSDLDATLAWAAKNKGSATVIGETGFCRGGRNTWLYAAHNPHLKAAVAFYGPIKGATSRSSRRRRSISPTNCNARCSDYTADRTRYPVAHVHQAKKKAKAAHKTVEIDVYPDSPHGFHADYRPSYPRPMPRTPGNA